MFLFADCSQQKKGKKSGSNPSNTKTVQFAEADNIIREKYSEKGANSRSLTDFVDGIDVNTPVLTLEIDWQ